MAGRRLSPPGNVSTLFNSGADQPATYGLSATTTNLPAFTSGGTAVTYVVANNLLTASAGAATVFTFALNATATGAYTFTLVAARPCGRTGSPRTTWPST